MTSEEITTPSGTLAQQFGALNVHIDRLFELSLGLRGATEKKLTEIFEILKHETLPGDDVRDILIHAIDLCKCKEERIIRFSHIFERTILKSTHTTD